MSKTGLRILVISYYWPPSGGAGVQRWLKFTKHLARLGHTPIVYTPENPEFPAVDESLLKDVDDRTEVLKTMIWEPYSVYKRLTGRKKDSSIPTGFISDKKGGAKAEKVSRWIRGNWFIPDARKFWIKPSVKYLKKYLKDNPVDAVVSTGPPHSMHLIARALKKEFGLPWVADFRDPWTEIDFIDELRLTDKSKKKHLQLETAVLNESDAVVSISKNWSDRLARHASHDRFYVVPNGFDKEDFTYENQELDAKFTLSHVGSFTPSRNVPLLWEVLNELCQEEQGFSDDLVIQLAGQIDQSVRKDLDRFDLGPHLKLIPYMSHNEVTQFMASSQLLLLLINQAQNSKGILTGKVFEYLNTQRPVLSIGPKDGALSDLMSEVGALPTIAYSDKDALKQTLVSAYQSYKGGALFANHQHLDRYERGAQTSVYASIIEKAIARTK